MEIRTLVRTGDTPPASATRMRRRPPHILVTTPESLYILLTSESGRAMLATTRTVIVDEIHAVAAEQARRAPGAVAGTPGSALCGRRLLRVGPVRHAEADRGDGAISGRVRGRAAPSATIIDTGHARRAIWRSSCRTRRWRR